MWFTDKVIPATTSLDSVFLCLNGHGDSARCLPRCSLRLSQIECDLCNKPHQERTERIDQTFDFKTLTGSGKNPDGSSSLSEEEQNEKFEAIKRQMMKGESGIEVLSKTINNEAMTDLTGTPMYETH